MLACLEESAKQRGPLFHKGVLSFQGKIRILLAVVVTVVVLEHAAVVMGVDVHEVGLLGALVDPDVPPVVEGLLDLYYIAVVVSIEGIRPVEHFPFVVVYVFLLEGGVGDALEPV